MSQSLSSCLVPLFVLSLLGAQLNGADSGPKSPAEALACFQVRDGFAVELMAAEPAVQDPIAIAWGADGRLWVAEMGGYPESEQGGRIRFLEDRDGDGRFESSVVFLDRLSFPTSVFPWGRGILVTCAPDIFYAEDTTGDGRADHREVWFAGFVAGNPQHRVNGLRWGLDNWIHGSNGDAGGTIRAADSSDVTYLQGNDFRFCPRQRRFQLVTGRSQFGRCRDDWGNWFGVDSLRPFWHVVLEERYVQRNPYLDGAALIQHLMSPPTAATVFPLVRDQTRFNELELASRFTSACGPCVYRDSLFGSDYDFGYFVCEPAHQLVRHEQMLRQGASFRSQVLEGSGNREFLASTDAWFRPTQVCTGPDGALWVVDMYRAVIEHPEYMRQNRPDDRRLRAGAGLGRIYRVRPQSARLRSALPLNQLNAVQLVDALDTANGTIRDLSQQQLIERAAVEATDRLQRLAQQGKHASGRLAALWTLEGLGRTTPELLVIACRDRHPAVRRQAVRLSESWLARNAALQHAVLELAADPDAQVRLQVGCSLGEWDDDRAGEALAQMTIDNADAPFVLLGVSSSASNHVHRIAQQVIRHEPKSPHHVSVLKTLTRTAVSDGDDSTIALLMAGASRSQRGCYADWQFDVLANLLRALSHEGLSLAEYAELADLPLRSAIDQLGPVFRQARRLAVVPEESLARRASAIQLLGHDHAHRDEDRQRLLSLLDAQAPLDVQFAAIDALLQLGDGETPELLLSDFSRYEPAIRERVLASLAARSKWSMTLLDAIEAQRIPASTVTGATRARLLLSNRAAVRARAASLLENSDTDRQAVLASYQTALQLNGSVARGRELFVRHCATCHRLDGAGHEVGPALSALQNPTAESLLADIIDPNRSIAPRYVEYFAETISGTVYSGILATSTGSQVRLLEPGGKSTALPRSSIDRLTSSNRSLMPEDWERVGLRPQDMADLIAYLLGR